MIFDIVCRDWMILIFVVFGCCDCCLFCGMGVGIDSRAGIAARAGAVFVFVGVCVWLGVIVIVRVLRHGKPSGKSCREAYSDFAPVSRTTLAHFCTSAET